MRAIGVLAVMAVMAAFCGAGPVPAQATSCYSPKGKRVTMSGTIEKVMEMEMFIDAVAFTDTRTGCRVVMLEALLDDVCKPGRAIVATGIIKRSGFGNGLHDLDRGDDPPSGTLACR
jgi:hypothetical protein